MHRIIHINKFIQVDDVCGRKLLLTEGVTLSGAPWGDTVHGHTLESAILAAEGVRRELQISQAKGQSSTQDFCVIWRYAGFRSCNSHLEPAFYFSQGGRFLKWFF